MFDPDTAALIKATTNAVLALYGIPEPDGGVGVTDIAKMLNLAADHLRTYKEHPVSSGLFAMHAI